jgi:hypothetical protein
MVQKMTRRIAASMSLVAFFVCIVTGLQAQNPFTTVVSKALLAMAVTFIVGLVLGTMAQKMLDENISEAQKKPQESETQGR